MSHPATSTAGASPSAPAARLEELRAAKSEREAKRAAEIEAQELEGLELDAKLEGEIGARGREFDLLDCRNAGEGWIAVKRAAGVLLKRYDKAVDKAVTDKRPIDAAETQALILGCLVHPSREAFLAIVDRRPNIANECVLLVLGMASSRREAGAGK